MMLSAEQAQGLAMFLIQGVEREVPTTKKVLAAFPNDKLGFTLGEKGRTAKDLMWHTVTSDIWFTEGISSGAFPESESKGAVPATSEEMAAQYESGMAAGMAKVKAMTPAQLAKPISFFGIIQIAVPTALMAYDLFRPLLDDAAYRGLWHIFE